MAYPARSARFVAGSRFRLILVVWALLLAGKNGLAQHDRSPVDVALSAKGDWLVTANETSHTVSLVRTRDGVVLDEIDCGKHPTTICICPNQSTVLVSGSHSGTVCVLQVSDQRLERIGQINVGFEPHGVVSAADSKTAYVALTAAAQVAVLDLQELSVKRQWDVKRWPRYMALTPDGTRLAVGCSGDERIVVLDTSTGQVSHERRVLAAVNFGHMTCSQNGKFVYLPWMIYRNFPITRFNITQGWVLASRIARVNVLESEPYEKFSLDPRGKAVADPHGIALNADESRLVATASGTHELLVYRLKDLPFRDFGATGDHIDPALLRDRDLFDRIPLGGRPMGVCFAPDGKEVYVANYLRNSIQHIDITTKTIVGEFQLGAADTPSLERRGAAIFFDGERSLNQWYSCHSCHYNGGSNSRAMDTLNDGSEFTYKTVLPLYELKDTGPWTWHGWQQSLDSAMAKSLTTTMQGPQPKEGETQALLAFLNSLQRPPNPFRAANSQLSAAARRGQQLFSDASCIDCHSGPKFTDGEVHDVGLGSKKDQYEGYNTPSLVGVYRKVKWLHRGQATSLHAVLTRYHQPSRVSGGEDLTEEQVNDLVEYLKTL